MRHEHRPCDANGNTHDSQNKLADFVTQNAQRTRLAVPQEAFAGFEFVAEAGVEVGREEGIHGEKYGVRRRVAAFDGLDLK